jgi:hypothetical protein
MGSKLKSFSVLTTQQLEEILERFHLRREKERKKSYLWLIIVGSVLGLAAIGFLVYKFFFAPVDEYDDEDYYDDDYDDIDYDEDYDDDDDDYDDDEDDDECDCEECGCNHEDK